MRSFWHSSPLTRIVIALVIGITIGHYVPILPWFVVAVSLLVCLGVLLWRVGAIAQNRRSPVFGIFSTLCFLLLGLGLIQLEVLRDPVGLPYQKMTYQGIVEYAPRKGEKFDQLEIKLSTIENAYGEIRSIDTGCLIYAKNVGELMPGNAVTFQASLNPPDQPVNPAQYSYADYLRSKGIFYTGFTDSLLVNDFQAKPRFIHRIRRIQMGLVSIFDQSLMGKREKEVASALILGHRQSLDRDLKSSYADAGVVHILAVSGLHVGIIYMVLQYVLLGWMPTRYKRNLGLVLVLLFLWGYAAISGFSPSVLRATTMFSFIAIGKSINRYNSIYNNLSASAVLLLLVHPSILFEVGFQLSYAAVVGIALFFKPIHNMWMPKSKWVDKIWSIAVVSFCAQLMTFPMSIYYFHQFPNYFMISNLCIIPLTGFTIYSGLVALLLSWIPYLGELVFWIPQGFIWTLNFIVDVFANAPGAVSKGLRLSVPSVILLYITIFLVYKWGRSPVQWRLYYPLGSAAVLLIVWIAKELMVISTNEMLIVEGPSHPVVIVQNGYSAEVFAYPADSTSGIGFYVDGLLTERGIYASDIKFTSEFSVPSVYDTMYTSLILAKDARFFSDSTSLYVVNRCWEEPSEANIWCIKNQGIYLKPLD